MEYTLLGVKFRVEVVVVSLLIGWIIGAVLFCSTSRYSLMEGIEGFKAMSGKLFENAASLDYKMSAGIEVKPRLDKNVENYMNKFENEYANVPEYSKCS